MTLHPCPFCNSENVGIVGQAVVDPATYSAHCITCGSAGPAAPSVPEAAEKWNASLLRAHAEGMADGIQAWNTIGDAKRVYEAVAAYRREFPRAKE